MDHVIDFIVREYKLVVAIPTVAFISGWIYRHKSEIKGWVMFCIHSKKRVEDLEKEITGISIFKEKELEIRRLELDIKKRELELLYDKQHGFNNCSACNKRKHLEQSNHYIGSAYVCTNKECERYMR